MRKKNSRIPCITKENVIYYLISVNSHNSGDDRNMYHYAISIGTLRILNQEWCEALAASKFKRIELSCGEFLSPAEIEQMAERIFNNSCLQNIEIASVHLPFCPFERFPYLAGEKERNAIAQYLETFIRLTAQLGAPHYTYHASIEPVPQEERASLLEATRPVVERLAQAAAESNASLNVELLPRSCIGNCTEELKELLKGIPPEKAGICFDVNHLGGTPERVPEFINELDGRIRSLHLSDYDGIDEAHWLPGLGVLNWPAVMQTIRSLPGNPLLVLETAQVRPHSGRPREITPELHFHQVERAVFYLENCDEIESRIAASVLP